MKIIAWVLALAVIAGAAAGAYYYFLMPKGPSAPMPAGEVPPQSGPTDPKQGLLPGGEVRPPEETPAALIGTQGMPDESTFRWDFTDLGTESAPKTKVTLYYNLGTKELGTYDGSCTRLSETAWAALPGEVDGAICYFAGFGTEIAIFKEGIIYVAKKGDLEEGSEETGSVRGNFEVITAL